MEILTLVCGAQRDCCRPVPGTENCPDPETDPQETESVRWVVDDVVVVVVVGGYIVVVVVQRRSLVDIIKKSNSVDEN